MAAERRWLADIKRNALVKVCVMQTNGRADCRARGREAEERVFEVNFR
jgi:hypothetical protein